MTAGEIDATVAEFVRRMRVALATGQPPAVTPTDLASWALNRAIRFDPADPKWHVAVRRARLRLQREFPSSSII